MASQGHFADCAGTSFRECRCEPRRYFYAGLIVAGIFLVELVGGLLFGSTALWADSAHIFFDEIGIVLSFYVALRARHHDDESALRRRFMRASAWLLLAALAWVGYQAFERLLAPPHVEGLGVIGTVVLGLGGNVWQHLLLSAGEENETQEAQILHVVGDLLGGFAVLVGGAIVLTTGWMVADPICSLLVVLIVGRQAIKLLMRK